ncbi:uncharacterized protein BDV17DRAFT_291901 [Aspergillus undulatus]|uniref:uncharacterized protein n=1 Tax=Aspergillus undulatus TaxID=1810928 RepID=UPI003CCD6E80
MTVFASGLGPVATDRAVHIHVVTHPSDQIQVLPNKILAKVYDKRASHVGQVFFGQDLIAVLYLPSRLPCGRY